MAQTLSGPPMISPATLWGTRGNMSGADVDPSEYYFREALFFETPVGKYEWLNRIIAIAKGGRLKSEGFIDAYEVL
jgi:hypothetical protein